MTRVPAPVRAAADGARSAATTTTGGASARLGAALLAAGEPLEVARGTAPGAGSSPGSVLLAHGPTRVAHVAQDPAGAERLRSELALRAWAAAAGVRVPAVHAAGDGWVVSQRCRQDPLDRRGALALLDVVARLAAAGTPPDVPRTSWRAPRRGRASRLLRAASGRLPLQEFRAARARVAGLPRTVPAHGDLHDGNVLWDAAEGTLALVDLEYAGLYPAGWDLVSAWVDLDDPEARAVLRGAAQPVPHSGALAHWLALRHLGDLLTGAARAERDPRAVARARAVVLEARAWGRDVPVG